MEEDRRLRFNLLGRFQCALGEVEFKDLDITTWGYRILAYMAFSGSPCSYHSINDNCSAKDDAKISTDSEAFRKRRDSVKTILTNNGCKWNDYITADAKKRTFSLKIGTYKTDLQTFDEHYDKAEKAEKKADWKEYYDCMTEASRCYKGDLLEDVKGKWIDVERTKIKAKAGKAEEAAERYSKMQQGTEHVAPVEAFCRQGSPSEATLLSHTPPESPSIQTCVQGADTARRPGNTLWLMLIAVAVLAVGLVLLWVKQGHGTTAFINAEAITTTLPSRPVAFDATDWRPGNDLLPVGLAPEEGFTKVHFFRLRKLVAVPHDSTKLYVSISCGGKAHVVLAQLNEPEGNTEVATDGQTHRKWEWESGRSGRTMNGKVVVEVVVWLGTKPGDSTPPAIEGEYWFDLPEKEK